MHGNGRPGVQNAPHSVFARALASHAKGAERCQRFRLFAGVPGELPGGGLRPRGGLSHARAQARYWRSFIPFNNL